MEEIYKINENKALNVIAHRLNTINVCGKVYLLQSGRINLVHSTPNA